MSKTITVDVECDEQHIADLFEPHEVNGEASALAEALRDHGMQPRVGWVQGHLIVALDEEDVRRLTSVLDIA